MRVRYRDDLRRAEQRGLNILVMHIELCVDRAELAAFDWIDLMELAGPDQQAAVLLQNNVPIPQQQ